MRRSQRGATALLVGHEALAAPPPALFHAHLRHHFHGPPFDYVGLAAAAAASWIGVPGPGEPVLIAAGVLAAHGKLDIVEVILVAWVAASLGGTAGWLIGLKAGRAILTARGPLLHLRLRAVERGEEVFDRYPVLAIIVCPTWVAGIHRVGPVLFNVVDVLSALVWAVGIGLGAYFVGPAIIDAAQDLGVATAIGVLILVALAVYWEVRRRRARRPRPG
jgi:membrane protein DedA with SNARE-associated domain